MKSYSNLWEEFVSKENFELAYKNAIKGKSKQKQVREFKKNKEVAVCAGPDSSARNNEHSKTDNAELVYCRYIRLY